MKVGCCGVAAVHAFHGQAVAGEGIVGFLGDELFEHLAAGFLLFGHWVVPYYTGARESHQTRAETGKRMKRKNEESHGQGVRLPGRPVSASRSEMTEIVLPA